MKKIMLVSLFLISASARVGAQQTTCLNAGQEYGIGATICECPSIIGSGRTGSGGRTQIVGRRLMCNRSGEWIPADNACVDITSAGFVAAEDFPKYHAMYCPQVAVMSAAQTERLFETAPTLQILAALRAICRRLPAMSTQCNALIDAATAGAR